MLFAIAKNRKPFITSSTILHIGDTMLMLRRILVIFGIGIAVTGCLTLPALANEPTTTVHIIKYASDGTTVLDEMIVDYLWMEENLPVYGDGMTHYYHQGPVFSENEDDRWNRQEDKNVLDKDMGAVKGTNLKDLCDLVGGMTPGDEIKVSASDGFSKRFNYTNVYEPQARQGPIILTWYRADQGYVPDYYDGIKLVFFADNSTNPWGVHAFGVWDMHETLAEQYWHNFWSDAEKYPTTTGLSVKWVSDISIYSSEAIVTTQDVSQSNSDSSGLVDVIFDGIVTLTEGTFTWTADGGDTHVVANYTPHGALEAASIDGGFEYGGSWKEIKNTALIDWITNDYVYDGTFTWNYKLNGVYQDYFSDSTGVSNNPLNDGDHIEFYYGPKSDKTTDNATAVVRITVNPEPGDWTLILNGATTATITKSQFEDGIACGHEATYTDDDGNVWSGMPLWYLVGWVDDKTQHGPGAFNDALAADGYSIKVIAGDGWDTSLESADIARNNGYIFANMLNGEVLPLTIGDKDKPCWPLHLKGTEVFGGQQVGNIVRIELIGLPEPQSSAGWKLTLNGDVGDVITQEEFEDAVACHSLNYTDDDGNLWSGLPLWYLVGAVDDLESIDHWTINDTRATQGYTIEVKAGDGYNKTFASTNITRSSDYIVANTVNGEPLSGIGTHPPFPLKLVGTAISGGNRVGNIVEIELIDLPIYPEGEWNLSLKGIISDVLSQPEFEAAVADYGVNWTDDKGNLWSGLPLWYLCGWVDDRIPSGPNGFNDVQAVRGYKILVKAGDGYTKEFKSEDVRTSNDYIIAHTMNGLPLSKEGDKAPWPLRIVGPGAPGGMSVANIVEIELTEFEEPKELPSMHLIKYGSDGTTIMNETTVTYLWMEQNLPVHGDGVTSYKFEACTMDPNNLWDPNETYPGTPQFKIDEVVKGTSIKDLCELVGGMEPGTEIKLVAKDGYETSLNYTNIYEPKGPQGEAILAWWTAGDGYVPGYSDGMRLFFLPEDHIFGLWDMHECMNENYWHYFWNEGIQYPSCAGLSAKWVEAIKIYSAREADWNLTLEGAINASISKAYFEQALACTMGGHAATYTDTKGRTWKGLPLWLLCGWVDDENTHSENAYNETRALAGYTITVIAGDGYNVTIDSRETVRNSNYIVANTLNDTHILQNDSSWPLKLVGTNVTGNQSVKGVATIRLDLLPIP
jgi:DMSO/TMAO reductase YedYZ molybdopterin-dependent catalytic subunit